MSLLYLHTKIRNDERCPDCRTHEISLHTIAERGAMMAPCEIDRKELASGELIWKDEWVRRRNGDKYHLIPIVPDKRYDLNMYYIDTKEYGDKPLREDFKARYMLLIIYTNPREDCPDNRTFTISFHEHYSDVQNEVSSHKVKDEDEDEDEDLPLDEKDVDRVMKLEPVIVKGEEDNAKEYRLLKVEIGKTILLDELSTIDTSGWKG